MRIEVTNISATRLYIGFTGENNHMHIAFDCGAVFAEYPDAYAQMAVKPPVGEIYPKALTREGSTLVWDVTASDCANVGNGEYQITFTSGTTVVKSFIGFYSVRDSLMVEGEPPEPVEDWLTQVEQALAAFDGLTASAETLPEGSSATATVEMVNGHKNVLFGIPTGATGAQGEQGEQGVPGTDGVSPVVDVTPITGGNRVSITDATGTESFDVMDGTDGKDGKDGAPGADGVSPTVTVTPITDGHEVTITDKDGEHTFNVMNGEKGDPGTPGDPTTLIDDTTTTATNKTWSANKISGDLSQLSSALNAKQDAPETAGTAGQVLSLDSNLDPVWVNQNEASNSPIEYKFSGSDILLGFGYNNTNDAVIVMNRGRANNLFDFAKLCTKAKGTSLQNLNTSDLTTVWSSGTDMHGPFQFLATNNADGYHSDAVNAGFVGGNHTLDQLGTGFETATSVYVEYYADGKPVSSGYGKATHFEIRWANDVQAYNTVKQGGGGRACLREYHDMIFDGVIFRERITLKPLEEIKLNLWYGLQCVSIGTTYTNIAFVDATNRGTFSSSDSNIKSGNAVTSGFIGYGNDHRIEMNVSTVVDLGKRSHYSGTSGAFVSGNKGYFFIIGTAVTMGAGEKYYLDGSYRFMPNIVEGIPCTGIALDQNTLTFDSAEETKTLTATVTPANTTDTIEWTSSNENIATVNSSGVVTIHGIGSATITATCGSQTATATISQTTLKPQYGTKKLTGYSIGKDSNILKVTSNSVGLNCLGQVYDADHTDLQLKYGFTSSTNIELIRVPYGATKACIATTNNIALSISYGYIADTNDIVTVSDKTYPAFVSQTTWVNTDTGLTVEYGQAVGFTVTDSQLTTLDYVYFK